MKENKFTTLCLWMIILLLSEILGACNKYLDKKQNSALNIPASLADMQAILDDNSTMNKSRTPALGETSCDEYFLTDDEYDESESIQVGSQKLYTWQYYPLVGGGNDWSACYLAVYNANLVLDQLKNIKRSSSNAEEWGNVKGSALFYRSYYFLCLLWNYAKAYDSVSASKDWGIALRLTSDFNVPSARATNQQSYEQVIIDTKASLSLLPVNAQNAMRPSKAAAYGLLARCYLSMRDYKDALLYSDSTLQISNQLMNFNTETEFNGGIAANVPFKQFNKETIFYSEINTYQFMFFTSLIGNIDSTLYSSYSSNDLRKKAYFYENGNGYQSFKGTYTANINSLFSGMATDEMYLIRGEAFVRLGEIQKGLDDLNALLANRYDQSTFVPVSGLSQSEALELILKEREKELLMRGLRWMDLKRLNREGENIVLRRVEDNQAFTLEPDAGYYALPLPEDIIQMTGMPQNTDN